MARMIPQRKSPPYLLIIMAFLFLVSTGLAVKMYMDREDIDLKYRKNKALLDVLATEDQLKKPVSAYIASKSKPGTPASNVAGDMSELCRTFTATAAADQTPGLTVVSYLQSDVEELARNIVGGPATAREALRQIDDVRKSLEATAGHKLGGLLVSLRKLEAELAAVESKGGEIDTLKADKAVEVKKTAAAEAEIVTLGTTLGAQIVQIQATTNRTMDQLKTEQAAHETQMTSLEADKTRIMEELNKEIAVKGTKVAELDLKLKTATATLSVKEAEIAQLKSRIAILERKKLETAETVRQISADGLVMSDPDRQGYCYINLGAKDGVKRNWTFAVYAQGPITESTENKGALVVTRVLADVAECRLTKEIGGKVASIAKGDLIANLAFDASRTYVFTVEGVFDLHGTGKATLAGTEGVKALIANYGGKISPEVAVNTDYVVLGNEMPKPVEPGADAPPQVRQAYEDNLKIWQRYNDVKKRAIELKIPVLNANRFLDYIGQMPEKRLEYSD